MRHFNIPIFIPELACPFRCVYCNQFNITGNCIAPKAHEVKQLVDGHLKTILPQGGRVEVAFFGGSFTGLSMDDQNEYLDVVKPYLEGHLIHGIRISTRPDYISEAILENLKERGVVAIELGAQSMDDEVLKRSGRGHTRETIMKAAGMIKDYGFELGLQMMTGLPGDTNDKAIATSKEIIKLKADTTRIYPTLVLRDTPLANLYLTGRYIPQKLEEAIELCAVLYDNFMSSGVKVLRTGLHPSEGFFTGETLLAGPFHQAFGELVLSQVWKNRFRSLIEQPLNGKVTISLNPADLNAAIGHKSSNKIELKKQYPHIVFKADFLIKRGHFDVDIH